MVLTSFLVALVSAVGVLSDPVIWDGRAPTDYTADKLDGSNDPYLTVVKGSEKASHYTQLLGNSSTPTPLWAINYYQPGGPLIPIDPDTRTLTIPTATSTHPHPLPVQTLAEQVLAVSIDNSSVFVPGGNPQYGFRRTDIIAQKDWSPGNLLPDLESNTTVFHFSIKEDPKRALNYNHEYQIVFIEPSDGSHIFGLQLGSPFTNPTGKLPAANARNFKVLDHKLNVLFSTPFTAATWHNFAVQVDWNKSTLAVLYSKDSAQLRSVTRVVPNPGVEVGTTGEFHFGVLKLPLVNPKDTAAHQGDVVHYGIQEGKTEGLLYSGIFVESAEKGISTGGGHRVDALV